MNEERLRILEMVKEGKITPEEGARLLEELDRSPRPSNRVLRVKIVTADGQRVQFSVPVSVAKSVLSLLPEAARETIQARGINVDEIAEAIERGGVRGPIVDIKDARGAVVEVLVE